MDPDRTPFTTIMSTETSVDNVEESTSPTRAYNEDTILTGKKLLVVFIAL